MAYKGSVKRVVSGLLDGVRSGFSYGGASSIQELQADAEFVEITAHGFAESLPTGSKMILLALLLFLSAQELRPQQLFAKRCAACHGEDARGTAKGPGLAMNPRVAEQSAEQLRAYLERGNPGAGMPSFADLPADDLSTLARYLRRLNVKTIVGPVTAAEPARKITWGAPQPGDWLTYNGNDSGKSI